MSSREWTFRIEDILLAIRKIQTYTENMTLSQFKKNELVVDAVVRNFEIIGEASKHIPASIRKRYSDIPWAQMGGMRNILIHEYFGVDTITLWHTTKRHLPTLKKQLEFVLLEKE